MSTNYVKRLFFDLSNNVGVGTDRPQAALDVSGNISCANIIASGNISSANIIANGNIVPGSNISYDLGSSTNRWRDIYLSGSTIDLSGTKIQRQDNGGIKVVDASGGTVDGTFNNVTIDGAINQSSTLDVSGSILPTSNLIYDLGSDTNRWRDIYLSGSTIDLSGTKLARHTNGNLMVKNTSGTMLGVTMDHIDLNGTIIRRHTDGSVVIDNGSGGRVTGRFGDLDVSGNISGAGNIDVSGNVIASGNISASNLTVGNNLTVNGTTTTINSTTVTVQDPIITLGSDITNTKDKGIEFKYDTNKIGFFGYDDSTGNFSFLKDASNNNEVFSGTQGTIEALTFTSTVASGTAPLTVASSTVVANLNADLLEGLNPSQFMRTDANTSTIGSISLADGTATNPILMFTADTNTGFYRAGNDILGFATGGSEKMRIDASGNIGIGTNKAFAQLHLTNSIIIGNGLAGSFNEQIGVVISGSEILGQLFNTFNITSRGNSIGEGIRFSQQTLAYPLLNKELMFLDGYTGNVGIGITNPRAALDVSGNIYVRDGTVSNPALTFSSDTNTGFYRPGNDTLGFVTGGSEKLRIDASGNIGIGVTAPLAPLHIQATSNTSPLSNALYIYNPTNSVNQHAILSLRTAGASSGNPFISFDVAGVAGWAIGQDRNDSNKLKIANAWNSISDNTRVTLTTDGNVGIGITNPTAKLHVNGTFYAPGCVVQKVVMADNTGATVNSFHSETTIKNPIISITPKFANSLITFEISFSGYHSGANDFYTSLFIRRNNIGYANRISSSIGQFFTAGDTATQWGDWTINWSAHLATSAHAFYSFVCWDYPNTTSTVNYIFSGYNHQVSRSFIIWSPFGVRIIATEIAV